MKSLKTGLMLLGVSLLYVLSQLKNLVVDGDTFWAIKVGEWISNNRAVPTFDPFSWTVKGHPWVAHEWLYDLLVYKLYTALGNYGIVFLVFIAFSVTCYLLWELYNTQETNLAQKIIVFSIVIFMIKGFIVARPQVFSYMFFVIFLYVLIYKKRLLWTLPFITVLWANIHGSVVLGVAMLFLQVVYDFFFKYITEKKIYIDRKLLALTFIVPLFSLLNPYSIEIWKTAFWLITSQINHQIIEWKSPDFTNTGLLVIYLAIIILTTAACYKKREISDNNRPLLGIYLTLTFSFAIMSVRYYPYLAICWGVFFLNVLPKKIYSNKTWTKRISFLVAILLIISTYSSISKGFPLNMENAIDARLWPIQAVKQLEQKRTLNEYTWGGYLILKDIPVFIDGRADVYQKNSEVFSDYLNMVSFKTDPVEILDKYNVEQVIIPVNIPLDVYLKRTGWSEKYRDETAVIFTRR